MQLPRVRRDSFGPLRAASVHLNLPHVMGENYKTTIEIQAELSESLNTAGLASDCNVVVVVVVAAAAVVAVVVVVVLLL